MLRSCIKISGTVVFRIPRSASSSRTVSCQSLLIAACACSTLSGVLLVAGLPEHGSLSTDSYSSLKCLCYTFICAALIDSSPKAWIIRIVSAEKCSSLTQNLMQIHPSICSVIFNAIATQYTCALKSLHSPHWLVVQWSHHCSFMSIPVHSPWLPSDINVTQAILIILTMAGIFPERSTYMPCRRVCKFETNSQLTMGIW